jgi:hypothetical protein
MTYPEYLRPGQNFQDPALQPYLEFQHVFSFNLRDGQMNEQSAYHQGLSGPFGNPL